MAGKNIGNAKQSIGIFIQKLTKSKKNNLWFDEIRKTYKFGRNS